MERSVHDHGCLCYFGAQSGWNKGQLFHLFWWKMYSLTCLKMYSLTCLYIRFSTWAEHRMNILGRANFRFSRCFSSVYVLFCITPNFFKTFLWRLSSNTILWKPIKHYFVEAPARRQPSLPSPKSGAVVILCRVSMTSCIYHCLSSSVISESFLAMKNCDDQCYQ